MIFSFKTLRPLVARKPTNLIPVALITQKYNYTVILSEKLTLCIFQLPFVSDLKLSFDSFRLKKRHISYKDIGKYVNRKR